MALKEKFSALFLVAALLTGLVTWHLTVSLKLPKHLQKIFLELGKSADSPVASPKIGSSTNNFQINSGVSYQRQLKLMEKTFETLKTGLPDVLKTIKIKNISVERESDCRYHKFIVYTCDYSRSCGGLGDRLKGIVSTFLFAIASSRVLVINFNKPCSIENALIPQLYNWSICRNFVKSIIKNKSKTVDLIDGSPFFKDFLDFNFDLGWPWQVIFLKTNSNLIKRFQRRREFKDQKHKWLKTRPMQHSFALIFHTLFKPTEYVLDYLDNIYKNHVHEKTLVCSHVRIGANPTIPRDNTFKSKPNKTAVLNFLQRFANSERYVIYIASDSDSIRREIHKTFDNSIKINISAVHIDRLGSLVRFKEKACNGFKFALIEQLILSTCDILLLTSSGFGIIAAYLRGQASNLYMLHGEQVKIVNLYQL